jgi:prepilin-type N-terminal cleavage/methylation domain-containing protein
MKYLRFFFKLPVLRVYSSSPAFTLLELLVVIGVLGVLAGGLVMVLDPGAQIARARDAERKSDLSQLQRALELYYDDHNVYPDTDGYMDELQSKGYVATEYLDPVESQEYRYFLDESVGGQAYRLYAHLEGKKDLQACDTDDMAVACDGVPSGQSCGVDNQVCNYGVSSPNVSY